MNGPRPGFFSALVSPVRGVRFLLNHTELIRYMVVPWVTTVVGVIGLAIPGWIYYPDLRNWIWSAPESAWLAPLFWLFSALFAVIVAAACCFGGFLLGQVIAAPTYTRMAIRVRTLAGDADIAPAGGIKADVVYPVVSQGIKVLLYLVLLAGSLGMHLVPGIGTILGTLFSFLVTVFWIALDYFDYPLDTESDPLAINSRIAYVVRHGNVTLGFAVGMFVLLLIPLVNILLLPVGVISATLLHRELEPQSLLSP
jgi:CysZ protein